MTPLERRASVSLASLFALRMLGLFLILPVFAVHARSMPGGDNGLLVGFALGGYALTQGMLQLVFGAASDRYGRKPVIVCGLLLFAAGSFVAAFANDVATVAIGRAIQGAGAISAAVTAALADATRESQRTKAMALIGGSIALTFALSLVIAPALYAWIGMAGLFEVVGALALAAIAVTLWAVPDTPRPVRDPARPRTPLSAVAFEPDLMRLNVGIFTLHAVQLAMFAVMPQWLIEHGEVALADHWKVYLPVVLLSFGAMVPPIIWAERRGFMRTVLFASIGLMLLVELLFAARPTGLLPLSALLLAFFIGFNVLEAILPSMVSRLAPADAKGAALGVYNTTQAIGLAVGGLLGGWVLSRWGPAAVFLICAALVAAWLAIAVGQRRWPTHAPAADGSVEFSERRHGPA